MGIGGARRCGGLVKIPGRQPSKSVIEDTQFRGDRHSAMLGRGAVLSSPCRVAGRGSRGLCVIVKLIICLARRYGARHHRIQHRNEESGGEGIEGSLEPEWGICP